MASAPSRKSWAVAPIVTPSEGQVVERVGRHEDAHHVGDVVGAQAVGAEGAHQQQAQPGQGVQAQQVQAAALDRPADHQEQHHGDAAGQQRAHHPGADDAAEGPGVGHRGRVHVPADDGADDGLGGGDRQLQPGHPEGGQARGQGHGEGARQGVDLAQAAQGVGRARAADGRAQGHDRPRTPGPRCGSGPCARPRRCRRRWPRRWRPGTSPGRARSTGRAPVPWPPAQRLRLMA